MKLRIVPCILLFALALCRGASAGDIDDLLSLPEKKIDIGIAALTLAKEVYPELDVAQYSAKLDQLVKGAKALTGSHTDPDYRVAALNTYLYKKVKIKYDLADPSARKLENRYLNGILDTKKGSCITMPLLYMAIAQRLGYPVYPVTTPDHFFLRYVDSKLKKQNIEATSGGGYAPDRVIIKDLEVSELGIKTGAYMRTLTYREYLASLLAVNAIYWAEHRDITKGINYIEKAIHFNPQDANLFDLLGQMNMNLSKLSRHNDPIMSEIYWDIAFSQFERAKRLGFTRPSPEKYKEDVKKQIAREKAKL